MFWIRGAYGSSSEEKLLSEPTTLLDHTSQLFDGLLVRCLDERRSYISQIYLEWSILMVDLLVVHVLGPIEEMGRRNLGKDLAARKQLDDLLLQVGQDVMLRQAHEFFELSEALGRGVLVLGQEEFLLVEELEHLFKGNGVVGHQGKGGLLGGTFFPFGSLDFFVELGRAPKNGLVCMELRTLWAELDDENRGCEVPFVSEPLIYAWTRKGKEQAYMKSELSASPPGVVVEVARGADLINALLRGRFLAGTAAAPLALAELAFDPVRRRLPAVFFGTLALVRAEAPLVWVALVIDDVESESLPASAKAYVAEKLEQAESGSSLSSSSEGRSCSGNTHAGDVVGSGSPLDASTVSLESGNIIAAVPGLWCSSGAIEAAGSLEELTIGGLNATFLVIDEGLTGEGDAIS